MKQTFRQFLEEQRKKDKKKGKKTFTLILSTRPVGTDTNNDSTDAGGDAGE